jgi:hypothetical protein
MRRGLLFVVVIFATALAAPIASATEIGADEYAATLNGQQTVATEFDIEGNDATCESASLSGTLSEPAEAVSLTPSYSGCSAFGFVAATINPSGCSFVLHAGSEIEEDRFAGTADVSCETGKKITIVASTCEAQIGSQSGLSKVEFTNHLASSPVAIAVAHSITGLKYNKTKDGFLCPFKGTGEVTGAYTGTQLVKAAVGGNAVGAAAAEPPWIEFGPPLEAGPPPALTIPVFKGTRNVSIKNKTRLILSFVVNDTSALPFKKTGTTCGPELGRRAQCENTLTTEVGWPAGQMGNLVVEIFPLREYLYPIKSP